MSIRKIVWEKWKDPLLNNLQETEWPGYDLDEDDQVSPVFAAKRQPVLFTPFGALSVHDHIYASSNFDFWLMHTNFDITESVAGVVEEVDGVETLEVMTRYRARIGMPKSGLFQPRDVMATVESKIKEFFLNCQNYLLHGLSVDVAEKVIETKNDLADKFTSWSILVLPNGNMEILCTNDIDKEYVNKLATLKETQETVGGRLITSES